MRLMEIATCVLGVAMSASGAFSQANGPYVVYADSASPTAPQFRDWDTNLNQWSSNSSASSVLAGPAWQLVIPHPSASRLALVSLSTNKKLEVQIWDGANWGPAQLVASDTGIATKRVFGAAREQSSGNFLVAYRKQGTKFLYYQVYDSAGGVVLGEQKLALTLNKAPNYINMISKPNSNEILLLIMTDKYLYSSVWKGSSFVSTTTLETALPASIGRPCAAAYMGSSGAALVTWGTSAGTARYAIWNGTAWSNSALMPSTGGKKPTWVVMTPAKSSDEVIWAALHDDKSIYANYWNGSAWSASNVLIEATAPSNNLHQVDACYRSDGTSALLVWSAKGSFDLQYRTWDSASKTWSATQIGPNVGSVINSMQMVCGSSGNQIHQLVSRKSSTPLITDFTVYSDATVDIGTTDAGGDVDSNVSGVNLPAKPAHGSNNVAVTVLANSTLSLIPGTYGVLVVNSNGTLNLTAGNYIFKTVSLGDGANIICDTAAGDTSIAVGHSGFTIGNSCSISRQNTADPGNVSVHVCAGNALIGTDFTMDASKFYVYVGTLTIGDNAAITSLVASKGNLTMTTGTVNPSDAETSGGQLIAIPWTGGSPGTAQAVSTKVTSTGAAECYSLGGARSSVVRVLRWYEVGPDD